MLQTPSSPIKLDHCTSTWGARLSISQVVDNWRTYCYRELPEEAPAWEKTLRDAQ